MRLWRKRRALWHRLSGKKMTGDELSEEMGFHLEMETERNLRSGRDAITARHAAGRDFRGVAKFKEQCRDQRPIRWLATIWQDVRYGVRVLAKSPGFTAVAVLSLAMGIGATTAVFSAVNAVLLRPLPYKDPDRLVQIWEVPPRQPGQKRGATVRNFLAWRERNTVFEHMAVLVPGYSVNFTSSENPEILHGQKFTAGFLEILGVQPLLGRSFLPEEYNQWPDWPLIISHGFWERRFGRDPGVIGRAAPVEGMKQMVIGVMPPGFGLVGTGPQEIDYWGPRMWNPGNLESNTHWLLVVAKLKEGVTLAQAQAAMGALAENLARDEPARNVGWTVKVEPLHEAMLGYNRPTMLTLAAAVGFVLLIACVNVAGLLLGRASARQREIAIRLSIGAGRARVARQLLTESVVLSFAGGIAGLALAQWVFSLILAAAPEGMPRLKEASIDGRVLAFTLAISILTGILLGLAPALQGTRVGPGAGLSDAARGSSTGSAKQRLRQVLVVAEIAIALVLLAGSGLLINSFLRLTGVNPGFDAEGLLTFGLKVPQADALEQARSRDGAHMNRVHPDVAPRFQRILDELRTIPGVKACSLADSPPMSGWGSGGAPIQFEGRRPAGPGEERPWAAYVRVGDGFFQTLGVPLLRGRDFSASDVRGSEWVAIVNEAAARRYWPGEDPIGERVTFDLPSDEPRTHRIVGVVRSLRYARMDRTPSPEIYVPHLQQPLITTSAGWQLQISRTYLLRLAGSPDGVLPAVRRIVAKHTGNQPVFEVQTVEQIQRKLFRSPRFAVTLLGAFAAFGMLLAAAGVFAVMSYSVVLRTREIGLRMALGAQRGDVIWMLLTQGLKLAVAGVVIGLAGAAAATRLLESRLYEVKPTDAMTFALVSLLLLAVTVGACFVPVQKATKVDPMEALRHE